MKLKKEIFNYFLEYANYYKSPFTDFITKKDYLDYVRFIKKRTLKRKTKDGIRPALEESTQQVVPD